MENTANINFDAATNYFRSESNEGNFIGLVKLMAGESVALAEHIEKCVEFSSSGRRNPLTFLSKDFINRVLSAAKTYLVKTIVSEINSNGGFYGVLMDASQDVSCKEQISIVVRYVDKNHIVERTICFVNASKDTSGQGLYELMRDALSRIGLSLSKIVGCSFDGASNMRSESIGVRAYLRKNNEHCIYTWCFSHRFNLVMKAATKNSIEINCILHTAEECAKLFKSSYTRMNIWNDVVSSTPNIDSKTKLKLIGTTRWSSKQAAIANIVGSATHLFVLIKCLIKLCGLPNMERSALLVASNALNFWLKYENTIMAFVLHRIYSLLEITTKYLQHYSLHILDGIKSLKHSIENLNDALDHLDTYIEEAEEFVKCVNSLLAKDQEIKLLDSACSFILPADDEVCELNARIKNVFHEFITIFKNEAERIILKDFDDSDSIYTEILYLNPRHARENEKSISFKKICAINNITNENGAVEEMKKFLSDFENHVTIESALKYNDKIDDDGISLIIETEDDLLETGVAIEDANVKFIPLHDNCYCFQCILKFFALNDRMNIYKNVYQLYKFVATLPSTQVKCERDFSKMRIVKSRLRSCLGDDSLESLMIISAESSMFGKIDLEDLIDSIIQTSDKISLYMG